MSNKRTVYVPALKTKVVLEVLKSDKTLNQISQEYIFFLKILLTGKNSF